jgi:alpha-tubulin suppressor-like RCC1 family protein
MKTGVVFMPKILLICKCIFYTFLFFIIISPLSIAYENGEDGRISAGKDYSLFIDDNGDVWAWGNNFSGKLGYDNTNLDKVYPVKIAAFNGKNITKILAGCNNSFAVDKDDNLWAWGENLLNYLGVGLGGEEVEECCQENTGPDHKNEIYNPTVIPEVKKVYNVTTSCNHTLILTNNNEFKVYAWGEGYLGQLGINDRNRSYVYKPMEVYNLKDVIDVSAGNSFSLALKKDGNVYTWGDNQYGQLGINFTLLSPHFPPPNELFIMPLRSWINNMIHYTSKYTIVPLQTDKPAEIKKLEVVDVSAGGDHALALLEDGTVWAWGRNDMGQLGDKKTYNFTNVPVKVILPDNTTIESISAGQNHSLALDNNGNVWAWGDNSFKQIGNNKTDKKGYCTLPVKVSGLTDIIEISAGANHNLALDGNGSLYGWGSNKYGQLGQYKNNLIIEEPQKIEITEKDQPAYILPRLTPKE